MHVTLTAWHDQAQCTWCEKDRPCVVVTFSDGFLKEAPMCWKCLQTAFKVRFNRTANAKPSAESR